VRVAFIGGTRFVGPVAVRLLTEAGHDVAVAHSGAHEPPDGPGAAEHLHGSREELLAGSGPVERWRPEVLVDTFAGGASADKARTLRECAERCGAGHIVAISSLDVYRHCVEAGIGDGTGAAALPAEPVPLREDRSALRDAPYPGAYAGHDNVAMEAALHGFSRVTALRPGSIYGPHPDTRERFIVDLVRRGVRRLELPDGGVQLFHRVAVERVGRAVVAAIERAPGGFWACNVVDPVDWEYAGLAGAIGRLLAWEWEPVRVPYEESDHPWHTSHPVHASDERLRLVLGVTEPDPDAALEECVRWLWEAGPGLAASA
jgi:nucleoside-diphosphate-sugar epimerase